MRKTLSCCTPVLTHQVSREKVPGNTEDSRALDNGTLTETGPTLSWKMAMAASLFPSTAMAALDTVDTSQEGKVAMVEPPPGSLGSNGRNLPKVRREERPPASCSNTQAATAAAVSLRGGVGVSPHAPQVVALSALVAAACSPCPVVSVAKRFDLSRCASSPCPR